MALLTLTEAVKKSMRSTTGAYLALGDIGVVWRCSKLQRKVANSSTAAETYALRELVKTVIEVYGTLVEMGETVETPVMLKQDNHAVIKMSETLTAHAGSKFFLKLSFTMKFVKVSSSAKG